MKENIKDNKENKESRRVQMTKKLLRESVIELMEQKPLNKISIKDICDNADVNRTTFYKYYGDQFELVKEAEDEVLEKLGEFLGNLKSDTLVISMLETFLYYIKENGIGKALFRERVCRSVLLHAEKRERRLTREQERAEQPRAAAEVAHALAALRRGEPAEREAVGRRREELRIKIKAGAALPEKVLAFHEASVP